MGRRNEGARAIGAGLQALGQLMLHHQYRKQDQQREDDAAEAHAELQRELARGRNLTQIQSAAMGRSGRRRDQQSELDWRTEQAELDRAHALELEDMKSRNKLAEIMAKAAGAGGGAGGGTSMPDLGRTLDLHAGSMEHYKDQPPQIIPGQTLTGDIMYDPYLSGPMAMQSAFSRNITGAVGQGLDPQNQAAMNQILSGTIGPYPMGSVVEAEEGGRFYPGEGLVEPAPWYDPRRIGAAIAGAIPGGAKIPQSVVNNFRPTTDIVKLDRIREYARARAEMTDNPDALWPSLIAGVQKDFNLDVDEAAHYLGLVVDLPNIDEPLVGDGPATPPQRLVDQFRQELGANPESVRLEGGKWVFTLGGEEYELE